MSVVIPPLIFASGAAIGSWLNVVILRSRAVTTTPPSLPLARGGTDVHTTMHSSSPPYQGGAGGGRGRRSHCPHCYQILRWYELIPILSFSIQRGRCRRCQHALSIQYPVVELVAGLAALLIFLPLPTTSLTWLQAVSVSAIIALLIIVFVIDLKTFLLPDSYVGLLTLAVGAYLLLTITAVAGPRNGGADCSLLTHVWGALIAAGFLALLWLITAGRGIGLGDVKLMLPLGALFGPTGAALLLFSAFIIGGAIAAGLLISGRATAKTPVPFGPFLAGVAGIFLLFPAVLDKLAAYFSL